MPKNQEPLDANVQAKKKSLQKIKGGCHCQAIRFEASVNSEAIILNCNCSICKMTGFQHLIVNHHDFKLLSGKTSLSYYQFNTQQAKHLFCQRCGIKSFYQPRSRPKSWSINVNCLDDFDPDKWQFNDFDGINWEQAQAELNHNY